MKYLLAADIGSTFTKLTAISIADERVIGVAKAFTTIGTDVRIGFDDAFVQLKSDLGSITFDAMLASSSAAGGLKMVSCGLVPELSVKAGKLAAASAGAKLVKAYSYELSDDEQHEIGKINPDIILLSGGIDGGNKEVILHNAHALAKVEGDFSVIVAGNKSVAGQVRSILENGGKNAIICENVMPEFNKLNTKAAKHHIRELFIERIIHAKGLDCLADTLSDEIIPTPLAVFNAAELLSKGTKTEAGIGDLLAFDVGGATTDVYSMCEGLPSKPNTVPKGLPEPFAKRTVEGDIGMRYSAESLVSEAGAGRIAANVGVSEEDVTNWLATCKTSPDVVPKQGSPGKRIDDELAAMAVEIASNRHCGIFETTYTPFGETLLQTGKDLSGVQCIIGSGGAVINSANAEYILKKAIYAKEFYNILKPKAAKILLDEKNIFAAMGLLSKISPDVALRIMKREFR